MPGVGNRPRLHVEAAAPLRPRRHVRLKARDVLIEFGGAHAQRQAEKLQVNQPAKTLDGVGSRLPLEEPDSLHVRVALAGPCLGSDTGRVGGLGLGEDDAARLQRDSAPQLAVASFDSVTALATAAAAVATMTVAIATMTVATSVATNATVCCMTVLHWLLHWRARRAAAAALCSKEDL